MENRTLRSIFSKGRVSVKKVVSVVVAIALCVCMLVPMTSASALSATSGNNGQNSVIYSPLDLLPTDSTGAWTGSNFVLSDLTKYNADNSDVWQFEVEKQVSSDFDVLTSFDDQDFFADSTDGFAAPTVTATGNGTEIKVVWTAQDPVPDYYTVKVVNASATADDVAIDYSMDGIADEYKVINTSNSVLISDIAENSNYYIQVTAGDKASKLATYGSGSATKVKTAAASVYGIDGDGGSGNLDKDTTIRSGEGGMYWIADITNGLDYFNSTGALVLKLRFDMTKTDVDVKIDSDTTVKNTDLVLNSNFWFRAVTPTYSESEEKYFYPDNSSFTNVLTTTTDKFVFADKDMKYIASLQAASSGTSAFSYSNADWKKVGYSDGYIVIPFSAWTNDYINLVKANGNMIKINCSSLRYNYNGTNLTDVQLPAADGMNHQDLWDRTVTLESATVVSDYTEYLNENKLVESKGDGTVEAATDLTPSLVSGNVVYSKDGFTSSYVFTPYYQTGDRWWVAISSRTGIIWKAAKGEKMRMGFKAPTTGVYEFAAPIEADSGTTVAYAVSKVSANGTKTYLQDWVLDYEGKGLTVTDRAGKTYPDQFCDLQVALNAGDTVYLEAYCDTNAASINIGVPTARKLTAVQNGDGDDVYTYKLSDYIQHTKTEDGDYVYSGTQRSTLPQTDAAWELGYYANQISETGDVSEVTNAILDPNDMTSMEAGDTFDNIGDLMQKYVKTTIRDKTNFDIHAWDIIGTYAGNNYDQRIGAGDQTPGSVMVGGARAAKSYKDDTAGIKVCLGYKTYADWGSYDDNAGKLATGTWNVSSVLKFTAPTTGTGTLHLDNQAGMSSVGNLFNSNYYAKALVVQNGEVVGNYAKVKDVAIELSLTVGDEIYIVYYIDWTTTTNSGYTSGSQSGRSRFITIGNPYIDITEEYEYLTFDTDGGYAINSINMIDTCVNESNPLTLPAAKKAGCEFAFWEDSAGNYYWKDDEITEGKSLTAIYDMVGDTSCDNVIDIVNDGYNLRNYILWDGSVMGVKEAQYDVNRDGNVDISDLIRLKKYCNGIAGIKG